MYRLTITFSLCLIFSAACNADAEVKQKKVDEAAEQAINAVPDLENGRRLYRNCAVCHTPEGWGSPSGHYPQIAGQHRSVIVKQLADIHKGNRDNPTMMPFTRPLFRKGTQALADISAYVEQLPMVPNNSIGNGMQLEKGKQLYNDNCKKCHGENGEGDAKEFYPRLHGQHFNYLLRQMQWVKSGKRRNADKKMMEQYQRFSSNDLSIIADYTSRLKPDKSLVADHADWRNPDFRSNFRSAPRRRY
ncbi:MAG: c-type cytochrome [Sedimenticola sp.]